MPKPSHEGFPACAAAAPGSGKARGHSLHEQLHREREGAPHASERGHPARRRARRAERAAARTLLCGQPGPRSSLHREARAPSRSLEPPPGPAPGPHRKQRHRCAAASRRGGADGRDPLTSTCRPEAAPARLGVAALPAPRGPRDQGAALPSLPGCPSGVAGRSSRVASWEPPPHCSSADPGRAAEPPPLQSRPLGAAWTLRAGDGRPRRLAARGAAGDARLPWFHRAAEGAGPTHHSGSAFVGDAPTDGAEGPAGLGQEERTTPAAQPGARTAEEAPRPSQCSCGSRERSGAGRRALRARGRSRRRSSVRGAGPGAGSRGRASRRALDARGRGHGRVRCAWGGARGWL